MNKKTLAQDPIRLTLAVLLELITSLIALSALLVLSWLLFLAGGI